MRGKILETMVKLSSENKNVLESDTVMKSNQIFHILCDRSRKETGAIDNKRVYDEWLTWFKNTLKSV